MKLERIVEPMDDSWLAALLKPMPQGTELRIPLINTKAIPTVI